MTQELIHSANSTPVSITSAPSTQRGSTTAQLEADWEQFTFKPEPHRWHPQSTMFREAPKPRGAPAMPMSHRWGIVLAGDDDERPQEVTHWVGGDNRPKQFCRLLSGYTLLEETRHRAEQSLPPEQILYSVTQAHEQYYLPCLAGRPGRRIVQPSYRGTAPAILSALVHIAQTDPNAIVAVLPCDHYFSSERAFTASVESAFQVAEQRSQPIVLLGVKPESPEADCGWIEIGEEIDGRSRLFRVDGFQENPPLALAQSLLRSGSLWNTFVMVGPVNTFLEMARATAPSLLQVFQSIKAASLVDGEIRIPDSIYEGIAPTDFSRQMLALATDKLLALRLENIGWSDLGDPYRVLVTLLEKNGSLPSWASLWPDPEAVPRTVAANA
jgi:mannose-1-phosphate guanylyltransferase